MTDRHIRVDGVAGAPFLVLANSLGSTADVWAPQLPTLAARFQVVRYEHRGHGGTPSPPGPYTLDDLGGDLLAVLDEVGAATASVMGLSLGGAAAMWLAARHPQRVESLVVACSAAEWGPAQAWHDRIETVRRDGTPALLETLLARWFTPAFIEGRPDVRRLVTSMLEVAEAEGYAGCCAALAEADLRSELGAITAPTLVVAGATDPVVPIAKSAALAESIPGASLTVLAPGSHLVSVEQPERFTSAVLDHLIGNPSTRGSAIRRTVLGDAHVDRSEHTTSVLSEPFFDLITRYAWGDIWTRPGLDRKTRSCITLAMLVGIGRFDELELHLRAARRNGVTDAEIGEVLLHAAIYCGVPAANSAFAVARRVLEADDGG